MKSKYFLAAIAATVLLSSSTLALNAYATGGEKSAKPHVVATSNAVITELTNSRLAINLLPDDGSAATVKIYNAANRLVLEEDFTKANAVHRMYNFSQLTHGKYTVEVITAKGVSNYTYWR